MASHVGFWTRSLALGLAVLLTGGCFACSSSRPAPQPVVAPPAKPSTVTATSNVPGQGLDLQALIGLTKQAKDAESLERLLNQPGSINNLDLDEDGQVDYIRVQEYGGGNTKNFSFVALLKGGQEQEVANLVIEQTPGQPEATVQVQGHPAVYGPNVYYSAALPIATALFLAWALAPRPALYVSPYGFRRVPALLSSVCAGAGGHLSHDRHQLHPEYPRATADPAGHSGSHAVAQCRQGGPQLPPAAHPARPDPAAVSAAGWQPSSGLWRFWAGAGLPACHTAFVGTGSASDGPASGERSSAGTAALRGTPGTTTTELQHPRPAQLTGCVHTLRA
jgi:hypothetical protein